MITKSKTSFVAVTPSLLLPLIQDGEHFYFADKKQNTNFGIDCSIPFDSLNDALIYAEKAVRIFCVETLGDIYDEEDSMMGAKAVMPKKTIRNI